MHVCIIAMANKQNGKDQRTLLPAVQDCTSPDIPILTKRNHGTGGHAPENKAMVFEHTHHW